MCQTASSERKYVRIWTKTKIIKNSFRSLTKYIKQSNTNKILYRRTTQALYRFEFLLWLDRNRSRPNLLMVLVSTSKTNPSFPLGYSTLRYNFKEIHSLLLKLSSRLENACSWQHSIKCFEWRSLIRPQRANPEQLGQV